MNYVIKNGANVVVCKNIIGFESVEAYFNEVLNNILIYFNINLYFTLNKIIGPTC